MSKRAGLDSYSNAFHGLNFHRGYVPASKLDAIGTVSLLMEYQPRSPRISKLRAKWHITENDIEQLRRRTHSFPEITIGVGSAGGKKCFYATHPWTGGSTGKVGLGNTPQKALAAWDKKLNKAERRAFASFLRDIEKLRKEAQGEATKRKR